jgi:hypothetical protein
MRRSSPSRGTRRDRLRRLPLEGLWWVPDEAAQGEAVATKSLPALELLRLEWFRERAWPPRSCTWARTRRPDETMCTSTRPCGGSERPLEATAASIENGKEPALVLLKRGSTVLGNAGQHDNAQPLAGGVQRNGTNPYRSTTGLRLAEVTIAPRSRRKFGLRADARPTGGADPVLMRAAQSPTGLGVTGGRARGGRLTGGRRCPALSRGRPRARS